MQWTAITRLDIGPNLTQLLCSNAHVIHTPRAGGGGGVLHQH